METEVLRVQRAVLALVAVFFLALVGAVVYSAITDDPSLQSDAPAAPSTDVVTPDGEVEPASPSESVGLLIAGFVLIVGWVVGITVTILRAVHRGRASAGATAVSS